MTENEDVMGTRSAGGKLSHAKSAKSKGEISIGEMCASFGVTPRTLRFYEEKGLVKPARRGSRRFYSILEQNKFAAILQLRAAGISLGDVENYVRQNKNTIIIEMRREDLIDRINTQNRALETAQARVAQLKNWLTLVENGKLIPLSWMPADQLREPGSATEEDPDMSFEGS